MCVLALDKMQNGRRVHHTACLVNRSANSAFCALLVFLVMDTSLWWTFSLRCRENCYFSTCSPFLQSLHLLHLLSVILTLLLSPLLFSNLVSMRMLNLGRNDTYRVTWGKNGRKGLRNRDRGSESRVQISFTDTEKWWALLHSSTVNDRLEYLLSTLQHQGCSILIGRESIS